MKEPFLKGRLTKLSAALLAIAQTPNLLTDVSYTAQVFVANAEAPISYLSLVAAAGVIWGGIRRATGYKMPRLVSGDETRVEALVRELEELRRSQSSGVGPSAWAQPVARPRPVTPSPFEVDRDI